MNKLRNKEASNLIKIHNANNNKINPELFSSDYGVGM